MVSYMVITDVPTIFIKNIYPQFINSRASGKVSNHKAMGRYDLTLLNLKSQEEIFSNYPKQLNYL